MDRKYNSYQELSDDLQSRLVSVTDEAEKKKIYRDIVEEFSFPMVEKKRWCVMEFVLLGTVVLAILGVEVILYIMSI